jgi:hypothetical protein
MGVLVTELVVVLAKHIEQFPINFRVIIVTSMHEDAGALMTLLCVYAEWKIDVDEIVLAIIFVGRCPFEEVFVENYP